LGVCGGVLRNQKVPPELGGGSREEYGPVGEDWDYNRVEIEFGKSGQEGEKQE